MKSELLKNLNPDQKKAVTHNQGPALIVAGAGTGKTAVITRRIAYLIDQGFARPEEILALTFTEKASEEMDFRIYDLLPKVFSSVSVYTFHAFADSILRENAYELGLSPDYKVLSQSQQVLFLRSQLYSLDLKYFRPVTNPLKFIKDLVQFYSNLKEENITYKKLINYAKNLSDKAEKEKYLELARSFDRYEELKRLANFVDFADQLYLVRLLFQNHPQILKKYQDNFKYILVDEYQDTNLAQNDLVNSLAAKSRNLTVVGDDDQSIYKFRGASISNILNFKKTYPDAKEFVLTKNYRSTQKILDLAYQVIQNNNPDRLEVANKIDKRLVSISGNGSKPTVFRGLTLTDEVNEVTKEIIKLNKNGKKFSDIAILSRAASHATPFIKSLEAAGIPVQSSGTTSLYQTSEVKDIIYFLKTLVNFEDSLSLYGLASSEYFDFNPALLIKLSAFARNRHIPLFELFENTTDYPQLDIPSDEIDKIKTLVEKIHLYASAARRKNVAEVVYLFLTDHKIFQTYQMSDNPLDIRKIENISKFFDKLTEFINSTPDPSIINYVNLFLLLEESGEDTTSAVIDQSLDAVNVLTIHSSKGLEFDTVFIVNLVSERFPTRSKSTGIIIPTELLQEILPSSRSADLQEERRLFYVAVTRAKSLLYLTWAEDYGGARAKKPSQFLLEAFGKQDLEVVPTKLSSLEKINRFAGTEQLPLISPPQNQSKLSISRPLKLTQETINSYLTCPLQYKYSEILKMPRSTTPAMVLGVAVHKAIERFFNAKKTKTKVTLRQLTETYSNNFTDTGFVSRAQYSQVFDSGLKIIRRFFIKHKNIVYDKLLVEEPFQFVYEGVIITGRIDLISQAKDQTTILDFKTSEGVTDKKAADRVRTSIQLKIYALAFRHKYHKDPDQLGLYFLESDIFSHIKPTPKTFQDVQDSIAKVKQGITSGNFTPNPEVFKCSNCAFKQICPASLAPKLN